jgi:hypothetical protein
VVIAGALALILVLSIGRLVSTTHPTNDSIHYLEIARHGLWNNPALAAPFAYRPGTPLLVWIMYSTMAVSPETGFGVVAFLASWGLLIATYLLAHSVDGGFLRGLVVMGVVAFSFFHVKFPLAVPTRIDVEAFSLITIATWLLVRNRPASVLLLSCVGLFFKEFLLIPGVLLLIAKVAEYRSTRAAGPLVWLIASISLLFACFTIPRMVIPVSVAYGDNFYWNLSTASHFGYFQNLKYLLPGWPDSGKATNIVFSLCSYWLPVFLLVTPGRVRTAWERLSHLRVAFVCHVVMVLVLSAIGGSNVMIFVAYTGPFMVIFLTLILATDVHPIECAMMLAAICVFNRIPWVADGVPTAEDLMSFYAGWRSVVDTTTLHRAIEIALYLLAFVAVRVALRRRFRRAAASPP